MIVLLQRVLSARVSVDEVTVGQINGGFLALVGIGKGDRQDEVDWMVDKTAGLRVFADQHGKMNLALDDVGGSVLSVSQFTLLADCRKGRRPAFTDAALPDHAIPLYEAFNEGLRKRGIPVQTGRFGADMKVELINDGPVTIPLVRDPPQDIHQ